MTKASLAVAQQMRSQSAVEFDLMKENKNEFMPSRLFIYYNERDMEGTVDWDSALKSGTGSKALQVRETVLRNCGLTISISLPTNLHKHAMMML